MHDMEDAILFLFLSFFILLLLLVCPRDIVVSVDRLLREWREQLVVVDELASELVVELHSR